MILLSNVLLTLLGLFIIQLTTIDGDIFNNPIAYVVMLNVIIVWVPVIFIFVSGVKKWYLFYGIYAITFVLAGIFIPIALIITLFYLLGVAALKYSLDEQPV